MIQLRCDFSMEMNGTVLVLQDLDKPGRMSLTSDIEAVVEHIVDLKIIGGLKMPYWDRVIYKDSTGQFDEILIERGEFAGIRSLGGARDVETAINSLSGRG